MTINGTLEAWYFNNGGDKDKILQVTNFGEVGWINLENAFFGCRNLTTFQGGDTSAVTTMKSMFFNAASVVPDTSGWDTSSVLDMSSLFRRAAAANPDVSAWDTSSVTNMNNMFMAATIATPDVSAWDVSSVTSMIGMFRLATAANPDVSAWVTTNVTSLNSTFMQTSAANPDVSGWDTSSVLNMAQMFNMAGAANPDVSTWDVSSVTDMSFMFANTSANPDVSGWNTSVVTTMAGMFQSNSSAVPDTSSWDTSSVTSMNNMFSGTTSMDPAVLAFMDYSNVTDMNGFLSGVTVPAIDYSDFLIQLDTTNANTSVALDAPLSSYDNNASSAYFNLTSTKSWTITDGGIIPGPFIGGLSTTVGPAGTSLTITGTDFIAGAVVDIGGGASCTVTAETPPTSITCTVLLGSNSIGSSYFVNVTNYDGQVGTSGPQFTYSP